MRITRDSARVEVPARSVTTLLVNGVSGVDRDAPLIKPGQAYSLTGVQSGKAASAPAHGSAVTIETPDTTASPQRFTVRKVARGSSSNRDRYEIVASSSHKRLTARNGKLVLERRRNHADRAAQWIFSSTGDGAYSISNAGSAVNLEVGGQATSAGSPVDVWAANSGLNQAWRITERQRN